MASRRQLAALTTVALLAVGCGDSDEASDQSTPDPQPTSYPDQVEPWNSVVVAVAGESEIQVYDAEGRQVDQVETGLGDIDTIETRGNYALAEAWGTASVVDLVTGDVLYDGSDVDEATWVFGTDAPVAAVKTTDEDVLLVDAGRGDVIDVTDLLGADIEDVGDHTFPLSWLHPTATAMGDVVVVAGRVADTLTTWLVPLDDPKSYTTTPGIAVDVSADTVLTAGENGLEFVDPEGNVVGGVDSGPINTWTDVPDSPTLVGDRAAVWIDDGAVWQARAGERPVRLTESSRPGDPFVSSATWLPAVERLLLEYNRYPKDTAYVLMDLAGRRVAEFDGRVVPPVEKQHARCLQTSDQTGHAPVLLRDARTGAVLDRSQRYGEQSADGCVLLSRTTTEQNVVVTRHGSVPLAGAVLLATSSDGTAAIVDTAEDLEIQPLTADAEPIQLQGRADVVAGLSAAAFASLTPSS